MRRKTTIWLAAAATAAVVVTTGALGVVLGVELHRRWPIESAERWLEKYSITLRSIEPWTFRARVPMPRFEGVPAIADGRLLVFGGFYNTNIEASQRVDEYDPTTNSWRQRADMPVALTHTPGVHRGGEIWFAGGHVGNNPGPTTDQVWRYNPATDQWTSGPSLPEQRSSGGFVALSDGTLHYFGGYESDRETASATHWRLAPGDTVWHTAAPFPAPRGHLSAAVLDGDIYAIGGSFGHDPFPIDVDLVHRYHVATGEWSEVASLPEPRSHAEPGTFVHAGRIYVVGGRSASKGKASTGEVMAYDPVTNTWSFVALLPRALMAPVAIALGDDLFVTAGGEDGADPRNYQSWSAPLGQQWRPGRPMPAAMGEVASALIGDELYMFGEGDRATLALHMGTGEWEARNKLRQRPAQGHHHAAEVVGGEVYLIGGLARRSIARVQIYNPEADSWRFGPSLPYPMGSAASAVINGRIYVAGGIVDDTTTRQALVLDSATATWRSIAPMPRGRNHAASATDGRRLFVFGGRGPGSGDNNVVANGFDDVQIYDPVTDSWIASDEAPDAPAPLPQARGGMGKAAYFGGEFYVIGGETLDGPGATTDGVYNRVDIYNPVTNTWRAGPSLRTARHGIFPVVYGDALWVVGGGVRAAASTSDVVEVLYPLTPR